MKHPQPKILLFGKNGQAGLALNKSLQTLGRVNAFGRIECNLCQLSNLRKTIIDIHPDIIVNAIAYNAVDQAENSPDIAYAINAQAPQVMAECAAKLNILLVHYSSDYIFDGSKGSPYIESDQPNPLSVYGRSKWQAEQAINQTCQRHLIFRTSWLHSPNGTNFLNTILKLIQSSTALNVVSDQTGTPTSAELLAAITQNILLQYITDESLPYGTYHLVSCGGVRRDIYAKKILCLAKKYLLPAMLEEKDIQPIMTIQHSATFAARPIDSRLDNSLLQRTFHQLKLPTWQEDLEQTIRQIASAPHD